MPFLPVAAREARGAARSMRLYAWRSAMVGIGVALVPAVLWMSQGATGQGPRLFAALSTMAFLYCLIGGALQTADALAEERRENTLGLLFLTDLKASDVLSGKWLASTATVFFGLLAILPILAIPVLLGGITPEQFLEVAVNLLNTLFLSIAIGFFVSTQLREAWATVAVALLFVLFLGVAIPAITLLRTNPNDPILTTLVVFSPTYAHELIFDLGAARVLFWTSVAVNHLLGWLCIFYTAKYLPRAWQEIPRSARAEAWWQWLQKIRFGGTKTRVKFRRRLLDSNPLYWLSGREQVSSSGLELLMLAIVGVSVAGEWAGILLSLVVLHLALLTRMASAASYAFAEDRKSGALELLLATSLSVDDVLRGRWLALRRQFFGPAVIVTVWHFFAVSWMGVMEYRNEHYLTLASAWVFCALAWVATGWCGMWFGLRARHPLAAMSYTIVTVWIGPWLAIVVGYGLLLALGIISPASTIYSGPSFGYISFDRSSNLPTAFILWGVYLGILAAAMSVRVKEKFREAASDRFANLPLDWTRLRRALILFASLVTIALAALFGYRAWINYSGERALQKALAKHPEFSLQRVALVTAAPEENLARWDFLGAINDGGAMAPYFIGRGPRSLREVLVNGYVGDPALEAWRHGEPLHIKGRNDASVQETARAYLKRFQAYDHEVDRLLAAAKERSFIQFAEKPALAPTQFWQPPNYWAETMTPALVQFLARRACARIQVGDNPLQEVLLCLRLAAAATNSPNGPQLWRQSLTVAMQSLYDGFAAERWLRADRQRIREHFEGIDALGYYKPWLERAIREKAASMERQQLPVQLPSGFISAQIAGYSPQQELPGKIKQRQAAVIRFGLEKLSGKVDAQERRIAAPGPLLDPPPQDLMDMRYECENAANDLAQIQIMAGQVVFACALEDFREATGNWPASQAKLLPQYFRGNSALPVDAITGEPLKYQKHADGKGYVVYSVGLDRKDDNGKPEVNGDGDWAWIIRR